MTLVADFSPIFFLIALSAVLGRRGFFSVELIEGLKGIVANIALPALLFGAFARVSVGKSLGILALLVFCSCGALGFAGNMFSRWFHLPRPSTVFLFQGFEAGMLGYALFTTLFGREALSAFAVADLGQVVFVFTVLMAQLRRGKGSDTTSIVVLLRGLALSPVMIAIVAGLVSSTFLAGAQKLPWTEEGLLYPLLETLGSLTTPLVCLVVGFSLKDLQFRGIGAALLTVMLRLLVCSALGAFIAFMIIPTLGYGPMHGTALLILFILPPPFVIPVFRKAEADEAYIGSVLSLHTILSILAAIFLAAFSGLNG